MAYNSQQGYGTYGGYPNPSAPPPPGAGFGGYPPPGNGFPQAGPGYPQSGYPPQPGFAPQPQFPQGGTFLNTDPGYKRDELNGFSFSDKTIRAAFIRKVYGILMIQLFVTFGFVAVFVLNDGVKLWTRQNPMIFVGALIVSIVCMCTLACCEGVRRKAPGNFICLGIFTVVEGFLLGAMAGSFKADSVLLAVGITAVICLALTAFSFQTKYDFTGMGSILFIILIVFMLFGLLTIFLPKGQYPVLHIVYACCGAALFSFYLIYDTQLMLGGDHKYSISPEEYIFAALNLYLDVVNIFIYILSLLGDRN